MKRVGDLYGSISQLDNLQLAFWKAAKGKHDRQEVMAFRKDFHQNIQNLHQQLVEESPEIGNYRFFHVRDPKHRLICAAAFPERVLHHAIMNRCETVLERYLIYDSYACRKGKGLRKALARAHEFAGKKNWFLKLDIQKYFDSIDHGVMLSLLGRRFKDKKLLGLFQKLLASYCTEIGKGIPIGNLISQHLANYYLGIFDHWLKEEKKIRYYLRYMDDFVLFAGGKETLKSLYVEIEQFLSDRLQLRLHQDVQLNRCCKGVPFLGFRVFPDSILLNRRSKNRFIGKFKQYEKNVATGVWSEKELIRHIEPLLDFTRAAKSFGFRKNVLLRYGVLP